MDSTNDNLIPLRVMGLSYNQLQNGAYALLLAQIDGPYRIPVVIGAPEAQSIAIALEGIITPRPLTHDLFSTFAHAFGVQLTRVFIYKFEDGIFSSELTFSDGERVITLDSRTSDAIALAMRTHAPIYTTAEIIGETGFIIEEADTAPEADGQAESDSGSDGQTIEEMERELQRLIDNEEYEQAARLNEILRQRKASEDTDIS
ncbi:MAG: bifunctional nuclease family protein [Muribaculaceae bacterium]|nr:bifunctional nuclease family protein [Muribaculaceae bacterium]